MPNSQQFLLHKKHSSKTNLEVAGLTAIALVIILLYASTLTSPFIFDDEHTIKDNVYIRLTRISISELREAAFESPHPLRPVSNIGFALNYYLHQKNVVGYHATNVLVHLITAYLFFFLLKTTLGTSAFALDSKLITWIALSSTLIWAIHPIQTQSVSYIVQRMNSQATLFFLMSMLLYAKARMAVSKPKSRILMCGCIASGFLAIGSKEIAATLPFFILLYEWFFIRDLEAEFPKKYIFAILLMVGISAALSLYYLEGDPVESLLAGYVHRDFSPMQRLLTEARVIIYYISLLVLPHPSRLNLDHDYPISFSLLNPASTIGAIFLITVLAVAAVLLARRYRLLSFSIIWYLGNLVIESSIIGLEIIFEHRLYMPSLFPVAAVLHMAFTRIKPKSAVIAAILLAGTVCSVWTYQRNQIWADPVLFWQDCIIKTPSKPRPYNNLGIALAANGDYQAAAEAFRKAIQLKPKTVKPYYNLASILVLQDRLDEAVELLKITLHKAPANHLAHNNLALIYMRQDRLEEAEDHLRDAIRLKPDYDSAYSNLGVLMRRRGNLNEAITLFKRAIELNPEYAEAHNNLGYAFKMKGDNQNAIKHFERALQLIPDYDLAKRNLEEIKSQTSRPNP